MRDSDKRERKRGSLWPWVVGVPLLVVMVVMIVAAVYFSYAANRRLTEAVAVADRDDPNWRLEELMAHREQVPDAENSALIMAEARAVLPDSWPADSTPAPGGMRRVQSETEKAHDELVKMSDRIRMDEQMAAAIRADLEQYSEAVRIARKLADYLRGRHELRIGRAVIDTLLPETQAARSVAMLLRSDAAMRVHDGDADGAIDSSRAILNAGRSIGDEPFLISMLVRIAIGRNAMSAVRRTLGQGEPSEAALSRIQALILDEASQPLLLQGMRGERATMSEVIRKFGSGQITLSQITGETSGGADVVATSLAGFFTGKQRAVGLEWMNDAVAIAKRPTEEQAALWKAWDAKIAGAARGQIERLTMILPRLLVPGMSAASQAFLRYRAELGTTAILIAAERHRRKTGNWPASIDAIDRSILASAPVDPFTGKAFHLEHRDGQLVIYSVGPNLKDEHGEEDAKRRMSDGPDDIAARAWDVAKRGVKP
jgi:hypothetical protein